MKINKNIFTRLNLFLCDELHETRFLRNGSAISADEVGYIKKYLANEPDCEIKNKFDNAYEDERNNIMKKFTDDSKSNFDLMVKLSAENNYVAMSILGEMFCRGIGCEKNIKKGLGYIVESAIHEYPGAQYLLAQTHYDGRILGDGDSFGKYSDRILSAFWAYRSAINGHKYSQWWYPDNCSCGKYDFYHFDKDLLNMMMVSADQGYFNAQDTVLRYLLDYDDGKNVYYNKELGLSLAKKYMITNKLQITNILREYDLV